MAHSKATAVADKAKVTKGREYRTMDGCEAVAYITYKTNEVIAIYPITPASAISEWTDAWAADQKPNVWGIVPTVFELQSEAGAAGTVHGALQTGSLTTTFTASQGLLLMLPNMYKIAGELTPTVFHVAARSLAAQGLSIFGDQSDVMAARATGFSILASSNVQEAMDFALIAQAATLKARVPLLHFFDGFRTSHEIQKIEVISDNDMRAMVEMDLILEYKARALNPEKPVLRGTSQNPDVYFQARETVNQYYDKVPGIIQEEMNKFAKLTDRQYHLYEYDGMKDAENIMVVMGSAAEAAHETVDHLNHHGHKVGVLDVRLFRPFDIKSFVESLPAATKAISVMDRCKEPGSIGEPLYLDVVAAIQEGMQKGWAKFKEVPKIVGGRYGLSSKEFNPAMIKGVYDSLESKDSKNHFTVGINDDVTHTSLDYDKSFFVDHSKEFQAMFYGLGSDGTVGANKNSIKIIGEHTDNYAQGYFVYDSKKAGSITISHLRFGPDPIRSTYLIRQSNFVGVHKETFLELYDDVLDTLLPGGTFLLNTPYPKGQVWKHIPEVFQKQIIEKKLKFYAIDAYKVAHDSGLGQRVNTIMQTCFFAISGVIEKDEAIGYIKDSIEKSYGSKGEEIVQMNLDAVAHTLENLFEVEVGGVGSETVVRKPVPDHAPEFVKSVLGKMIAGKGDELPVSALPADGTYPTGTTQYEKRNIALEVPVWEEDLCIQCGKCIAICPHSVIRMKAYDPKHLEKAPETFKSAEARNPDWKGDKFTIQVAVEDCTGCSVCVDVCPAKDRENPERRAINMKDQLPLRAAEAANWDFFQEIPRMDPLKIDPTNIRKQQYQEPYFEFSSACAGCGETPYIKMMTQLFGDHLVVANATGCTSIYGGNLPTTPWTKNDADGRGPAWANSLFEDNAEFGLGFKLSLDKQAQIASRLLQEFSSEVGAESVSRIIGNEQKDAADIHQQREDVGALKKKLEKSKSPRAKEMIQLADNLIKKSVWIMGGDGWAYDIGYGGLDHVLASGINVNILVLDTEGYSNTGGQMSKATPLGAIAKFATGGKPTAKKDLGLIAMTYGNVYVANVSMGAKDEHTLKAFIEAEKYDGPSLIIAYSPCISHGVDLTYTARDMKSVVDSGQWPLYRFNPDRIAEGKNPFQLDSQKGKFPVQDYLMLENRFKRLTKDRPEVAKELFGHAQDNVDSKRRLFEFLAGYSDKPEA